jgi:hypothetical protein
LIQLKLHVNFVVKTSSTAPAQAPLHPEPPFVPEVVLVSDAHLLGFKQVPGKELHKVTSIDGLEFYIRQQVIDAVSGERWCVRATLTDASQVAEAETQVMRAKVKKLEDGYLLPLALPKERRWRVFGAYLHKDVEANDRSAFCSVKKKFKEAYKEGCGLSSSFPSLDKSENDVEDVCSCCSSSSSSCSEASCCSSASSSCSEAPPS